MNATATATANSNEDEGPSLRRRTFAGMGLALLAGRSAAEAPMTPAAIAAWPVKPVRILVGYPGGSAPDVMARAVLEPIGKRLGQPMLTENKAGAAGNIALDNVARASDDHTLGVVINGNLTTAKLTNPNLPFDPLKDLRFVSMLATTPLILVTQVDKPAGKDFFAAARAAKDNWNYGSVGVGSATHLWIEMMKLRVPGMAARHVPFNGAQQMMMAIMQGQVQLGLLPPAVALPQIRAGRLRAIGIAGGRSSVAPDIPPLSEAGVDLGDLEGWAALVAPARFPAALADRLSGLIVAGLKDEDVRKQLFTLGWRPAGTSPDGLRQRVLAETSQFRDVITRQHIVLE